MKKILTIITMSFILFSCSKEHKLEKAIKRGDGALVLILDSASIHIPNVFTPNGDGVNDSLKIFASGISWLSVEIKDKNGVVVYEYSYYGSGSVINVWNGVEFLSSGVIQKVGGMYTVRLRGETEKAEGFDKEFKVSVILNPAKFCFKDNPNTYFGTQFDGVNFNSSLPTGEPDNCR